MVLTLKSNGRRTTTTPLVGAPAAPARQFSFTSFSIKNPSTPQPGDKLDSEYDQTNTWAANLLAFLDTSINTDGSLRAATVGEAQLQPGLFDFIATDAINQVQPLVDDAQAFADAASSSASQAAASAGTASSAATAAQGATTAAWTSAGAAQTSAASALTSQNSAIASASSATDNANATAADVALSTDYANVCAAWAEHMPDTIPPNILAVMGITGEHWSSRWWAHKAAGAFGAMSELYLGVWATPPSTTSTGDPIPIGAIYYNSTSQQTFVWTGTNWEPLAAPTKSLMLTLIYNATAGQTAFPLTTLDLNHQSYTISANDPEPLDVYLNGTRIPRNAPVAGSGDWDLNPITSTITFLTPLLAGTVVQIDILSPASALTPSRVQTQALLDFNINPSTGAPGQIDGVRTSFPLALTDGAHTPVTVASTQELFISIDGVTQQPGTDFTTAGSTITFTDPPIVNARAWGAWYGPGTGSVGGYLPISGGVLTGPLTTMTVGFNSTAPITRPTVFGACAGNTAIKNLLTALASYGLVFDSTSA